ncbi:MAG: universal stress protein [Candidatus Tectomicrobia bacterium]|nr:universal stress protein [Candidatus Tectomicrobia bacterium]
MKEFRRILAPTDFSPYSEEGLRYAAFLARKFGAEVVVYHVLTPKEMEARESLPPPSSYVDEIYRDAEKEAVDQFHKALGEENGLRVRGAASSGVPFVEIIRKAREEGCDLIVMATHGRTGLSHILMGSVAEKVVRMADCPVITIRPADHKFEMP